jgi:hypothetical protein
MRANLRDPLLTQAFIAAALSFAHIHDIADAAGQHGWKAWAYPISVDLLLVMAWKQIREAVDGSKRAPRVWFFLSLAASMGANIATAGVVDLSQPPTFLRILVAGWPVLAFFGGSLLVHSRKPHTEEPQAPDGEPVGEPEEEVVQESVNARQAPRLVTYREAADLVGVAPETIRGAANGPRARLVKYPNPTNPGRICVDLNEVSRVDWRPVSP